MDHRKSLTPEDEKRLKEREQQLLRKMDETQPRDTNEAAGSSPCPNKPAP
jgi:hypothetical protein